MLPLAQGVSSEDPFIDRLASYDLLIDKSIDSVLGHTAIPITFGINHQDRTTLADPQALDFGSIARSRLFR
jgi:hypothetical protein